jgi:phospholipid transport system substrate-binding protein
MVTYHARVFWILILFCTLSPVHAAWAGTPTDELRDGIDQVFRILRDPAMAGDSKLIQRRTSILAAAGKIFDFGEMAKRSLGQHWTARTPAERGQFVALFTDLMQHSYISKVDQHGSAKMVFGDEKLEGDHATVRTVIPLSNGSQMPLEYRMHQANGRWQVYDIGMDGISLLANYRAQFNKVIRIDSYAALVTKLQSHQSEFSQPETARSSTKRAR